MEMRQELDLGRLQQVPDVPALGALRPQRRPSVWGAVRAAWTPGRTVLSLALTPVTAWLYAAQAGGLAWSNPLWAVLTVLTGLGAAFVVTTYLGKGASLGGTCGLVPLVWVGLAGWLVAQNPTPVGAGFGVVMVAVAMVQRVTRPAC